VGISAALTLFLLHYTEADMSRQIIDGSLLGNGIGMVTSADYF
jgi:hypothetical protein